MIDRSLFLSSDSVTFDGKRAVPSESVTKLMLELADLKPGEKVLEIGTGSGYQTACLAELEADIWTIDVEDNDKNVPGWPVPNCIVSSFVGDGKLGWPRQDEFDCVMVSCGMSEIPPAYNEQLREGGRLIIPLGKPDQQELLRLEKRDGKLVLGRCAGYVRFQMCS